MAEIDNFSFENINPRTAVIDKKGSIWFGTKNQILKFDGSKWKDNKFRRKY